MMWLQLIFFILGIVWVQMSRAQFVSIGYLLVLTVLMLHSIIRRVREHSV